MEPLEPGLRHQGGAGAAAAPTASALLSAGQKTRGSFADGHGLDREGPGRLYGETAGQKVLGCSDGTALEASASKVEKGEPRTVSGSLAVPVPLRVGRLLLGGGLTPPARAMPSLCLAKASPTQPWREAPTQAINGKPNAGRRLRRRPEPHHLCGWKGLVGLVQEMESAVQKLDREHWEEVGRSN